MKRVYLAGPEVFRPDARAEGDRLKALCATHGLGGIYPLDGAPLDGAPLGDTPPAGEGAGAIRARCIAGILAAQGVVANISPFRGAHMDPGTAWEIGFAQAKGRPVFLWSADPRPLAQRIPADPKDGALRDADGHLVEDFDQPENLMIVPPDTIVHSSAEAAIEAAARVLVTQEKRATVGIDIGWKIAAALAASYAVSYIANKIIGW